MTTTTTGADGGLRIETGRWDELLEADGSARPAAARLVARLRELGLAELQERQVRADLDILTMGITFTVYSDGRGIDRAWPFDVIPRVIDARGVAAHRSRPGAAPDARSTCSSTTSTTTSEVVARRRVPGRAARRARPTSGPSAAACARRYGVWAHICGSDLVRDADGTLYVLEDNLRVPSGVSYMLENRADLQAGLRRPVRAPEHPARRRLHRRAVQAAVVARAATGRADPTVVVLTPGVYNSAYFEHSFLAQQMGVRAGRGHRPRRRRRRLRLHAHDRRARSRST